MAQAHKFRKAKSLFSTTLSAGISTGTGETITPASVVGLPTDTEITLTIDRVDSSGTATPTKTERITGVISGGNLTAYTRGIDGSTEQAHSSGAVVEYIWNADDLNDLVDGILVQHSQAGAHTGVTANTATVASAVTASSVLTSAVTASSVVISTTLALPNANPTGNGYLGYLQSGDLLSVGNGSAAQTINTGAWTAFTPSWTNLTVGAGGTNTGAYCQIGKTVHFRTYFCFGTGSAVGTVPTLTLPVASASFSGNPIIAYVAIAQNPGGQYLGALMWLTTTTAQVVSLGTASAATQVSATAPFTWDTNDTIGIDGTYEAA